MMEENQLTIFCSYHKILLEETEKSKQACSSEMFLTRISLTVKCKRLVGKIMQNYFLNKIELLFIL